MDDYIRAEEWPSETCGSGQSWENLYYFDTCPFVGAFERETTVRPAPVAEAVEEQALYENINTKLDTSKLTN